MGAYDEDEHERRESKTAVEDAEVEDQRSRYHGTVEYDAGDSAEALLDQFKRMKDSS
jgi:hypothetical protein